MEAASAASPGGAVAESAGETTLLRYLESRPILVRGPSTGRHYTFSAAQPLQAVHARDVDALVRTGLFGK
ncbi:MAG: hypothetical protein LAQ30_13925 [Acidobacteriia bacterium]|nr:hypothetical protein [Terriglobia bacterium]